MINFEEYKKLLSEYISFKTISTDISFQDQTGACAEWLKNLFTENGFNATLLHHPQINPVVFAEYKVDPQAETVLVYGHYDVQPAEQSEGWGNDPFTIHEENGRLIARGIVDNKGQSMIHIFTVLSLLKNNNLKYNVKFLIEGNEETGNNVMGEIMQNNLEQLKCDYVMISDGEIPYSPQIEVGLRGLINFKVKYRVAKNNLHSGLYGSVAPNSIHELSKLISKFHNLDNKLNIPGFYDDVDEITLEQVENNKQIARDQEELTRVTGIKTMLLPEGIDEATATGLLPCIHVTGIQGGYVKEGYANIVPAEAWAKINVRLVASQDPEKSVEQIKKFIKDNTPGYVDLDIEVDGVHPAVKVDMNNPKISDVSKILESIFNEDVQFKYCGGGIPVVGEFKNVLGVDTILASLGNDDCNMHGVNENFDINLLKKGLEFSRRFFSGSMP